ncbi:MAG TPA: hypothetical protein ENK05_01435 [Gammaproteobacteria bacterium]|nr:hypothetical protein [Gammaproteobacteria bacterium]
MDTDSQQKRIQLYLSYRCNNEDGKTARVSLERLCDDRGYPLIYDENGTGDGDSLTDFMEDLVSMPVVFLFLSPGYFRSAWCLYELIRLHEYQQREEYTELVPLRLTADMDLKQEQPIREFWRADTAEARKERGLLAKHLKLPEADDDRLCKKALWPLIEAAWNGVIAPALEKKTPGLHDPAPEQLLSQRLDAVPATLEKAVDEEHQRFRAALREVLCAELKPPRLKAALKEELTESSDEGLAEALLDQDEAADAVATVTRVVKALRRLPSLSTQLWRECYLQADKLCSLLLLNSIDKHWWFQNRRRILRENASKLSHTWVLEERRFSEVVVSRSLTANAKRVIPPSYEFDNEEKRVKPSCEANDVLLFDASRASVGETLLLTIFQDLIGRKPEKDESAKLLEMIATRAKTQYRVRRAPIHYIVGKSFMDELRNADWYPKAREQWAGRLLFVVCDDDPPPRHRPPTRESQIDLLDQLALFKELEYQEPRHADA